MNKKKYLVDFSSGMNPKNRLQKELYGYIKGLNRVWICEGEFDVFFEMVARSVKKINEGHPRCKSEHVEQYQHGDDRVIRVGGDWWCGLKFLCFEE